MEKEYNLSRLPEEAGAGIGEEGRQEPGSSDAGDNKAPRVSRSGRLKEIWVDEFDQAWVIYMGDDLPHRLDTWE